MAHSAGRSNGVVADENEMESECVFLVGVARRGGTLMALQCCCRAEGGGGVGMKRRSGGGRADAGHLLF